MAYVINDDCVACGTCIDECPSGAISEGDKYSIDPDVCVAVPVQTSAHQALSPQANNLPPTENPIASPSTMMRMQFFLRLTKTS